MNREQMDERLWDFIDGLSSPPERSAVEDLIATHGEWQTKYRELLEVHQAMAASELEIPSLRFTKNVMDEIARYQVARRLLPGHDHRFTGLLPGSGQLVGQ
jgi:anti-sigma factor RsiW